MALTYEIDPRLGLIVITRTHNPPFEEWRTFLEGLLSDDRFRQGMAILEDRRQDREVPTRNEVEVAAAWIRANASRLKDPDAKQDARWAVLLEPPAMAAYGMVRVIEFLTDRSGVALRPFTDPRTARAWASGAALAE